MPFHSFSRFEYRQYTFVFIFALSFSLSLSLESGRPEKARCTPIEACVKMERPLSHKHEDQTTISERGCGSIVLADHCTSALLARRLNRGASQYQPLYICFGKPLHDIILYHCGPKREDFFDKISIYTGGLGEKSVLRPLAWAV